jgi:hypothetical protein
MVRCMPLLPSFTALQNPNIDVRLLFVSLALQPSEGYIFLVPRGFVITHDDAS